MSERSEQLQSLLVAYIEAAEKGQAPHRDDLLAQHPEFTAELAEFLDGRQRIQKIAPPAAEMPTMAPTEMPTAPLGTVRYFGDYELLEEIARGGMGVVYRARQVSLNRIVALKMILSGQLAGAEDVRRFTMEAEAAANLDHPNIVPIYEVGDHDGQHYFSMKLIEGGSLAAAVAASGTLAGLGAASKRDACGYEPKTVAKLLATVARAVHHAHQRGILHRDLKPGNILLDAQGEPHVTDFGLARKIEGDSQLTQSGAIVGTPSYMAPEQARGEKGLTVAVDVYALGTILYELLTGQPPFRAATPLDTLMQVLDREAEPPRRLNPTIDRDLETICLKCLSKEPAKRYESAAGLADDLERWQRGEPIVARRAGTLEKTIKWARRRPALAALAATVVLAAVALLVVGLVYDARLQHALGEVADQKAAVVQTRAAADELLADAQRTQERIAYMRDIDSARREIDNGYPSRAEELLDRHYNSPARGWEWHYLKRLCHQETRTMPGSRAVAWSPDGKLLATATPGAQFEGQHLEPGAWADVQIRDAADGRVIRTLHGNGQYVDQLIFNGDGSRLLVRRSDEDRLEVWDTATGQLIQHWKAAGDIAFRRDGKQVATAWERGGVSLWDVETGQLARKISRPLTSDEVSTLKLKCLAYSPDGARLAVGTDDKSVILFDTTTGKEERLLPAGAAAVLCVAFSADGRRLAAGLDDGTITTWNLKGNEPTRTFPAHKGRVNLLAISPSGERIASLGEDRAMRVWSVDGIQHASWWQDDAWMASLTFGPDDNYLATISRNGPIRFWEVGRSLPSLDDAPSPEARWDRSDRTSYAIGPDGRRFVIGRVTLVSKGKGRTAFCKARICYGTTGETLLGVDQTQHPDEEGVRWRKGVVLSPDGRRLATFDVRWPLDFQVRRRQTVRPTMRIWDTDSGKLLFSLEQAGEAVAFSADGRWIATLATNDAGLPAAEPVRLWDARDGKLIGSFDPTTFAETLAFSPDGRQLAVAGWKVWLLDVSAGGLRLASVLPEQAHCVAFDPSGSILATTDWPGEVNLWDTATGRILREIRQRRRNSTGSPDNPSYLAFSPDGRRLAYATDHETVRLLDVETAQDVLVLDGTHHGHQIERVFFSTDGHRLFWADEDGGFHVWDATPLPEDIRYEQLALSRVRSLAREAIPKDEVLQRLRDDTTLDEGARQAALRLAETIEDRAERFNEAAWPVVVSPGARMAARAKALRQAEYACRLEPADPDHQHTRAAALYRLGRYEEALDALRLTTSLRPEAERERHSEDLAFLAMTCRQLDRLDEARDYLKRLRALPEKEIQTADAAALRREAERLIEGQGAPAK